MDRRIVATAVVANDCPYERASFQDAVEQAIDNVIRANPSLFTCATTGARRDARVS